MLSALTLATVFVDQGRPATSHAYRIWRLLYSLAFSYALFSLTNNAATFAIVIIASGGGVGGGLIWVSQSRTTRPCARTRRGPRPTTSRRRLLFGISARGRCGETCDGASFLTVVDDLTVACTTLFILLVAAYGAMVLRPESCGFADR